MIKIENLKKTYDKNTRHANEVLHDISFTLPDRGFVCILGTSGCGKTSLLNAIGGLDVFDSGKITTDAARITRTSSREMERERNASFGYIFQNYYLLSEHSAAYNVFLGMHSLPLTKKEKMSRVKDALERVDMLRYHKRPVAELSGGQQQRVAIARAIARRPKVIFADEPTGNLDEANTLNICTILKELSRESLVVMVTHEEHIARFFADRVITLDEGRIVSDSTDWARGTISAGAKDTVYAGDYEEKSLSSDKLSLRLLFDGNAKPIDLTVISEADRIIIKVNDPRAVISSDMSSSPYLEEGKSPVLDIESFTKNEKEPKVTPKEASPAKKKNKHGLGFSMLMNEAHSLVSETKLKRFGTSLFIILLSFMLAISVADIMTVAHIDPEDFITSDSHILGVQFNRGPNVLDKYTSLDSYIKDFRNYIEDSGLDFDYIPTSSNILEYRDSTVVQFGDLSMPLGNYSRVNISRLDSADIISGRMPQRSDEVVIDRWVVDNHLKEEGILQNVIPNADYLIGKQLHSVRKSFALTIVGICDSGEPALYMSREALLAYGTCGTEVITLSEYRKITGDTNIPDLALDECIALTDNATAINQWNGVEMYIGSDYYLKMISTLANTDDSIGAKMIIADEALDPLYESMINALDSFSLWCSDKEAMLERFGGKYPENIKGMLDIEVNDKYSRDYSEYYERTSLKLDTRTIVIVTVILTSAIMLYLMQRSKMRERMDLVAVYRLLGIPKSNLLSIFAVESLFLTFRFALPTVLSVWLIMKIMAEIKALEAISLLYPLWAAGLTLVAIALYRLLAATLPVLRMLSYPPAKLAAKYDF